MSPQAAGPTLRRAPTGRGESERPPGFGFEFRAMGTACRIRLAGCDEAQARAAADQAIAEVRRIETKYSRYRDDSIVSRVNAAAGSGRPIEVDGETADLLDFAARLHHQSQGRFDITTGVLRQAWNFAEPRLPEPAALAEALARVGWQQVRWERPQLALPVAGMEIDFGGFAKEYAADRAGTLLAGLGLRSGLVNLGGDLRVIGPRPDGSAWPLGIAHPRRPDELIATLELDQGGLATSGDYERYFELDGQRHCHILDPRSGWPVTHWQSISVLAPACLAAGALTTIAMLHGDEAHSFLREQAVGFLTIDRHGRLHHEAAGKLGAG